MARLLFRLAVSAPLLAAIACGGNSSTGTDATDNDDTTDVDAGDQPDDADAGPDARVQDCPSVRVDTTPVTPTVQLLIDQSGSMDQAFGNTTRWEAVEAALTNPTNGVVAKLDGSVIFGASLYSGGDVCPRIDSIAPAIDNYEGIRDLIAANDPRIQTPTPESLIATTAMLTALPDDPNFPGSPRIILLATDGVPDDCANPDSQTAQPQSVAAAKAAYDAGFKVFILSVGDDIADQHLQDLANAGAGKPTNGSQGNAPFYNADNPAQLAAAFDTIIGGVRECTFTLDQPLNASSAGSGEVILGGQELIFNDPNGWTLVNSTTIQLEGTACTTFKNDAATELTAEFPCGVVID